MSRTATATNVGGLFFPQSQSLGIDRGEHSPALQAKIVYAGTTQPSFAQGSQALRKLADIEVSAKQVERVTRRIGQERVAERDRAVAAYQQLPLVERKAAPAGVPAPDLAVVGCDGGRLQILDRQGRVVEAEEAADSGDGHKGKHWREDKIGLLMTMTSVESAHDPCPEIPENFVDATRILKLARELKTKAAPLQEAPQETSQKAREEAGQETSESEAGRSAQVSAEKRWQPPEVQQKRLLGSRVRWPMFGPILAQAAWAWGFFGARRKAFIGDGSDNNWAIWRQHFSSFEPVLDFIHALSYVFAAALAGRSFGEGWRIYEQWIGWVWGGDVAQVIEALRQRQAELGEPLPEDGDTHPRQVVARSLTYLHNHQAKMKYADYRRRGLPITSSYLESAVKQFNQRVKGTEKFWSESGAEELLQLRGDHLSDNDPLTEFWQTRQEQQTGQRPYRPAAIAA